ncbi:uncharacterized protein LOC144728671 [Lampetra planeri]
MNSTDYKERTLFVSNVDPQVTEGLLYELFLQGVNSKLKEEKSCRTGPLFCTETRPYHTVTPPHSSPSRRPLAQHGTPARCPQPLRRRRRLPQPCGPSSRQCSRGSRVTPRGRIHTTGAQLRSSEAVMDLCGTTTAAVAAAETKLGALETVLSETASLGLRVGEKGTSEPG